MLDKIEDIEIVRVSSRNRIVIPKRFRHCKFVGNIAEDITLKTKNTNEQNNEEVETPDQEVPSTYSHK